ELVGSGRRPVGDWEPVVVSTSITDTKGFALLSETIERHEAWLNHSGQGAARKRQRRIHHAASLVHRCVVERMAGLLETGDDHPLDVFYEMFADSLAA